jgi:hypothetical protein
MAHWRVMIYDYENIGELEYISKIIFENRVKNAEYDSAESYLTDLHKSGIGPRDFYMIMLENNIAIIIRSKISKQLFYRLAYISNGVITVPISIWKKFSALLEHDDVSIELKERALWLMNEI